MEYYEFKITAKKVAFSRRPMHETIMEYAKECAGNRDIYMVEVEDAETWHDWTVRIHLKNNL